MKILLPLIDLFLNMQYIFIFSTKDDSLDLGSDAFDFFKTGKVSKAADSCVDI